MSRRTIGAFLGKAKGFISKILNDLSMNKHLLYGYRLAVSIMEYSFVLIPIYVHVVMLIAYIQVGGSLGDIWVMFSTFHVALPTLMYMYLLHKCRNGLSVSFMLRFRGFPAAFSLIIFLIYSISLSTLVLFINATSAMQLYKQENDTAVFEATYLSKALSLLGIRIDEGGVLYPALKRLVTGSYFEIYLGLLGTVIAVLLILLYSSSEFLSGELDVYIHKHSLRNIIDMFRKSNKKIVISGYGFLGKALVKGLFEHIMSTHFQHGIETGYVYVWNQRDNNLKLKNVASNVLIISKDSEEWDYRVEHPVYKNIGAEEVEYSLGQRSLVLVLGPNIRSDFLLKQSGSYDASIFAHTFRSKAIESFLHAKLHQLGVSGFTGVLAIRSTTSSSLVMLTMNDLTSKLHRYYPEYVFANLLLRRLYALLLKIVSENKKPLIVAVGRGKTLYYILESIRVLSQNNRVFKDSIYYSIDVEDVKEIMDIIIITNDDSAIPRGIPFTELINQYNNIIESLHDTDIVSIKIINNSIMLKSTARFYTTSLRHIFREKVNSILVPLIFSKPDSFSISAEIVLGLRKLNKGCNQEVVPIFIITSNIEGENIHSLSELLRVWKTIIRDNEGVEDKDFYIIISLLNSNEYLQVLELTYLYGYNDRVFPVNVYKTVKESLCSFISSIFIGED